MWVSHPVIVEFGYACASRIDDAPCPHPRSATEQPVDSFSATPSSAGIQWASGRLSADPGDFVAESGAPVLPQRAGYLTVVVEPSFSETVNVSVTTWPPARA